MTVALATPRAIILLVFVGGASCRARSRNPLDKSERNVLFGLRRGGALGHVAPADRDSLSARAADRRAASLWSLVDSAVGYRGAKEKRSWASAGEILAKKFKKFCGCY
jgi:hypothetical protein